MIDTFFETACELYTRVKKSGVRNLGMAGWIIAVGFLFLLLFICLLLAAIVLT
jgi:hypothetical protein